MATDTFVRTSQPAQPMQSLDEWDDFVAVRYREGKSEDEFRNYTADANPGVTEFYRQNHANQTVDFVNAKRAEFLGLNRGKKSILGSGRVSKYAGRRQRP
jgi:inositol oxygenase